MTKRTLQQIAQRLEVVDSSAAADVRAIAEYSRDDEQRDWLAYVEMCRFSRERRYDAAHLLDDELYPALAAMRALAR